MDRTIKLIHMHPIYKDFEKATKRLEEVMKKRKNDIVRDSAIKRFELCFDLTWKSIKNYAKEEGLECASPRSCFKTAFQLKLIEYDNLWLNMIEDRNTSVHLYEKTSADLVYAHIPRYLKLFKQLGKMLAKKENPAKKLK